MVTSHIHGKSYIIMSSSVTFTQKALKEKEEHVEQLLQERDLERSEVARAAAQVDKVGWKLNVGPVQN